MKKYSFLLACAIIAMPACENNNLDDLTATDGQAQGIETTFAVTGDFERPTHAAMTRAAITADGKAMTDLFVLDYVDGTLRQQLHQTSSDADFGEPTMTLDYGNHHIYFVCSRGKQPVLSTDEKTVTWGTVSDTFYKDYAVTVTPSVATSHNVVLDRVATKLSITINDALPDGVAAIDIVPTKWYYAIDYTLGTPVNAQQDAPISISVPQSLWGKTEQVLSVYGLSSPTEWSSDISITARDQDDDIMSQATITAAPFKVNRTTNYQGRLFTRNGNFSLSLNDSWNTEFSGEW